MAESVRDTSDRGTPQYVAYLLLQGIAAHEGKLHLGVVKADLEWMLRTYEKCLDATSGRAADNILKKK